VLKLPIESRNLWTDEMEILLCDKEFDDFIGSKLDDKDRTTILENCCVQSMVNSNTPVEQHESLLNLGVSLIIS
jgi:hypothetical protein